MLVRYQVAPLGGWHLCMRACQQRVSNLPSASHEPATTHINSQMGLGESMSVSAGQQRPHLCSADVRPADVTDIDLVTHDIHLGVLDEILHRECSHVSNFQYCLHMPQPAQWG